MKYLVTGGAGFIGSHIVKKLVKNGETVRVLDNFSTGRRQNLDGFYDKIDLVEGDLTKIEDCRKAVSGIDFIFHEGAIPSVPRSVKDPIKTNEANIKGTLNILTAAKKEEIKRLVYAASSSAYGNPPEKNPNKVSPKKESQPIDPLSPYALQKLTGEIYCKLFYDIYGLETVRLRYFNVFGPHQDPNSVYSAVIPLFIKSILKNKPPTIFGDGKTSRDFTFVDNVVHANLLAMKAPQKACGKVFNVAMGGSISLNELVEKINKILGKNIKPTYQKERTGDVKHSLAQISQAKSILGYKPIVSFEEGLKKTIEYYKKYD